jgi:hypothetical protein
LKEDMGTSLDQIIKWLKGLGIKVNHSKTEICNFHRNYCQISSMLVGVVVVKSKESLNVLGVEIGFNISHKH